MTYATKTFTNNKTLFINIRSTLSFPIQLFDAFIAQHLLHLPKVYFVTSRTFINKLFGKMHLFPNVFVLDRERKAVRKHFQSFRLKMTKESCCVPFEILVNNETVIKKFVSKRLEIFITNIFGVERKLAPPI